MILDFYYVLKQVESNMPRVEERKKDDRKEKDRGRDRNKKRTASSSSGSRHGLTFT